MKRTAREELLWVLQHAFSGELGATHAYRGHAASVRDPVERAEIDRIRDQEIGHRECVGAMLAGLGAAADPSLERRMAAIGRTIGFLCRIGGWFVPMYGAGRLEAANVGEYVRAARAAADGVAPHLVDELLHMAEVEWDHEAYFHAKCEIHPLFRIAPSWRRPGPRERIREGFESATRARA